MTIHKFELVLIGNRNVGKTAFVNRHLTGEFTKSHAPTTSIEKTTLNFQTNCGPLCFVVCDTAGCEEFVRVPKDCKPDAAIIMGDCSVKSYSKCMAVRRKFLAESTRGPMPIVLVGTKSDLKRASNGNIKPTLQTMVSSTEPTQYYEISTLNFQNFEKPFRWLARRLVGQPKLEFVAEPAPDPVLPSFNDEMVDNNKKLLQTALKTEVPHEITSENTDELPGKTGSAPATPKPKGEAGISLFNFQQTSSDPNRVFWPADGVLGASTSGEALPSVSSSPFLNSEAASQQTPFGNPFAGISGGSPFGGTPGGSPFGGTSGGSPFTSGGSPGLFGGNSIFGGSGGMSSSTGPATFGGLTFGAGSGGAFGGGSGGAFGGSGMFNFASPQQFPNQQSSSFPLSTAGNVFTSLKEDSSLH